MEGQQQGAIRNYASSSAAPNYALTNSYSCECIGSQPLQPTCVFQPKGRGAGLWACKHPALGSVSFSRYAKCRSTCLSLSPSGSQRFNHLSMLAGSTHCDVRLQHYLLLPSWLPSIVSETSSLVLLTEASAGNVWGGARGFAQLNIVVVSGLQWGLHGNKGSRKLYHILFGA